MRLDIDDAGSIGIIKDYSELELPMNAWTDGNNIRFRNGKVEKMMGHSGAFESSTASSSVGLAPYWMMPLTGVDATYWIYAGLNGVYATTAANSHTDITRTSGAYSANASYSWNGGVLSGLGILNNGVDTPQQWGDATAAPALSKKLQDLRNWPSATTAMVVRPFQSYLVALDITENGTRDPRLLWWSHPADAGTVPSSWDYTDPAYDSGRKAFNETDDFLIDCLPIRNTNMIYKQHSTWAMNYVGGTFIFSFDKRFESIGILSRRCVQPFFHKHLVLTDNNDIVVHDGQQAQSIMHGKLRTWLEGAIDGTYYDRSFVTPNYTTKEMWVCFPQTGATLPNTAIIWNWEDNTFAIRDLPETAHIAYGLVDPNVAPTYNLDPGAYTGQTATIDTNAYNATVQSLVMADPTNSRIYLAEDTYQYYGTNFTSYVERTSLPLGRQGGNGQIKLDLNTYKEITRVIPRINGTTGGVVNVYTGGQAEIDGTVTWNGPFAYTIGTDYKIDCRTNCGRIPAIKFESTVNTSWELTGYTVEFNLMGIR